MADADYQKYLCSREWGLKREAVHRRANGICERCNWQTGTAVHHLTYIRKYNEELSDLQLLCGDCHNFIHDPNRHPRLRHVADRCIHGLCGVILS